MSAAVTAGQSSATLDFSSALLFGHGVGIAQESVRCMAGGSVPVSMSAEAKGNTLTVYFPSAPAGFTSVSCTVDQSTRSSPAH
jgi:hypothetical protein